MFAAAKNGNVCSKVLRNNILYIGGKKFEKKASKKILKKFCENEKRVLYLHPLSD